MKRIKPINLLLIAIVVCSCSKENAETEIIPVYDLKTEFIKTMDLTDDIGFTFQYQHDSTDTYLCRYSTYFLRKSQTVENISIKRQGNELWINVDGKRCLLERSFRQECYDLFQDIQLAGRRIPDLHLYRQYSRKHSNTDIPFPLTGSVALNPALNSA